MGTDKIQSDAPSNLDLAREGKSTTDCKRQVALARHPAYVVRCDTARNPHLCPEALAVLGDLVKVVSAQTNEQVIHTLSTTGCDTLSEDK